MPSRQDPPRYYSTCRPYARHKPLRPVFRLFRRLVSACVPRHRTLWAEGVPPAEPVVFVCNHARAYGPLSMCTRFPRNFRPWIVSNMCFVRQVPAYARVDFWPGNTPFQRALRWVLSVLIALPAAWIMTGVEGIPVYHDSRVLETFRKSVQTLQEGKDIVLFPEIPDGTGLYLDAFADGFVLLGSRWAAATGKSLRFYPVYACQRLRTFFVGEAVAYDPAGDGAAQRESLCAALHAAMNGLRERADKL